jgi:hypothetical protein
VARIRKKIILDRGHALDLSEHVQIVADPVAAAYVLNALDPARPRPIPVQGRAAVRRDALIA